MILTRVARVWHAAATVIVIMALTCDDTGSRDRTRTYNLPVNSRTLCQLSYAGSVVTAARDQRSQVVSPRAQGQRTCADARAWRCPRGRARITIPVSGMYNEVSAAREVRRPTGALPAAT